MCAASFRLHTNECPKVIERLLPTAKATAYSDVKLLKVGPIVSGPGLFARHRAYRISTDTLGSPDACNAAFGDSKSDAKAIRQSRCDGLARRKRVLCQVNWIGMWPG